MENEKVELSKSRKSHELKVMNPEKDLKSKVVDLEKMSKGKETLDKLLGVGQSFSDRCGLGFISDRVTLVRLKPCLSRLKSLK